jgi:alpha-beta hydrolase superfamily lysophospholipase
MKRTLRIFFSSLFALLPLSIGLALSMAPASAGVDEALIAGLGPGRFVAEDGTILPMREWLPAGKPKAAIVALHGFADYSASFAKPASWWATQGVATFAYDQRGFGGAPHAYRWSGVETMESDAKQVARAVRARYPDTPLFLLGESMGGALDIVATTGRQPADVDGAILVSPAIWEHDLMGSLERSALWIVERTAPGLWLEPPSGLNIWPSDNIPMLRAMANDSLVQRGARADTTAGLMDLMDLAGADAKRIRLPTLVLFGAHEEILPEPAVTAFLANLPSSNVRVAFYPNGYHMLLRDIDGPIVWRDVLTWIFDRKAALPSGDECAGIAATAAVCRRR